jgi:hypothetical protein
LALGITFVGALLLLLLLGVLQDLLLIVLLG